MQGYPVHVHPSSAQFCVVAGCASAGPGVRERADVLGAGPHPRQTIPGSDLCTHHEKQLADLLAALATDLRELRRAVLATSRRHDGSGRPGASSTVSDVGARWNPAASPVARSIEEYAAFLTRTVIRERTLPRSHRHGLTTTTEASLALATLARHHASWLARYPDLGPDILDNLQDLTRRAHAALAVDPVQRVIVRDPAGAELRCADELFTTDLGPVLCEAPLIGIVTPTSSEFASDRVVGHIVCSSDPDHTRFPKGDWWRLNLAHSSAASAPTAPDAWADPGSFVSLDVAAASLGLSTKRTAAIAVEEGWRTAGTRPQQYSITDINRTAQLRGAHR